MEIITGRTGTPHVYAIDDAELNKIFLGSGDFVLTTGNRFNALMNGVNQIKIYDGSLIMQGRLAKIRQSDGFDSLSLDIGTIGYKRVDLIVAEYSQITTTTQEEIDGNNVTVTNVVESVELKVIKGTPNENAYVEPAITTGDIDLGETHQMKLWAVRMDGINFDSLIDYREILDTVPIQAALDYAQSAIANIRSYLNNEEVLIENELDRIRNVTGIAPLTVITASNLTSVSGILTVPSIYSYTEGDVFVVYLNGLRIPTSDYEVSSGTDALTVTLDYTTSAEYDIVEIEVWRPEQA